MAILSFGLLALLFIGAVVVLGIVGIVWGVRGFRLGHAKLNCPHCGAETRVTEGKCSACGHQFA